MAESNCQADSKRNRSVQIRSLSVAAREDCEDEKESYEELYSKTLLDRKLRVEGGQTEITSQHSRRQTHEYSRTTDSTQALYEHVDERSSYAYFSCDKHGYGHCWINMTATYVSDTPDNRGDSQSKRKRYLYNGWGVVLPLGAVVAEAGATADEG